jgi:hypothetical protein
MGSGMRPDLFRRDGYLRVMTVAGLVISSSVILLASAGSPTTQKHPTQPKTAAASNWTATAVKSEMDDTAGLLLRTRASNVISGWLKTYRPALIIRCKEKELEAYVVTGMSAAVESGDSRTVRVRFDDEPGGVHALQRITGRHSIQRLWTRSTRAPAVPAVRL